MGTRILLFTFILQSCVWAVETADEYEIKAAYLLNLGSFVRWPEHALQENITICILGKDPFGKALDLTANNQKKIQNKVVEIKRISAVTQVEQCAILFVENSDPAYLAAVFATLEGKPILTVGDSEHFVSSGGMIQFFQQDNKIRLKIAPQILEKHRLKASSHLMKIAHRIEH